MVTGKLKNEKRYGRLFITKWFFQVVQRNKEGMTRNVTESEMPDHPLKRSV